MLYRDPAQARAAHAQDANYLDQIDHEMWNPTDLAISRSVATAIRSSSHLNLVSEPQLPVLLFQRQGWDTEAYRDWSRRMARDGVILCVPTTWHGETVLRLAFVNPATQAGRVIEVLDTLR